MTMAASIHCYAPASHSILALRRPSAAVHATATMFFTPAPRLKLEAHLNLGFKKEVRVQVNKRWNPVFASNTNPSDGSDDTKASDNAQGPPVLTILAGLVVFSFVCWIIGSIVMWVIGLAVHPPPLN